MYCERIEYVSLRSAASKLQRDECNVVDLSAVQLWQAGMNQPQHLKVKEGFNEQRR